MGDMSRVRATISIVGLSLLAAACTSSDAWHEDQDIGIGVTLSYPSTFVPERPSETDVASGTGTLHLQKVRLSRGQGLDGTIMMMRSDNASLLASLSTDAPLVPVNMGGKDMLKFTMQGEGNPVGFVIQREPEVVAVAFANVEDEELIENVVTSISVQGE